MYWLLLLVVPYVVCWVIICREVYETVASDENLLTVVLAGLAASLYALAFPLLLPAYIAIRTRKHRKGAK